MFPRTKRNEKDGSNENQTLILKGRHFFFFSSLRSGSPVPFAPYLSKTLSWWWASITGKVERSFAEGKLFHVNKKDCNDREDNWDISNVGSVKGKYNASNLAALLGACRNMLSTQIGTWKALFYRGFIAFVIPTTFGICGHSSFTVGQLLS